LETIFGAITPDAAQRFTTLSKMWQAAAHMYTAIFLNNQMHDSRKLTNTNSEQAKE
jgi:hypothetical protein